MPSPAARSAAYSTAFRASGLRAAVMPVRCRTRAPAVRAAVHVLPAEGGTGGTGAVVEGPGDVRRALLEEHHPGAPGGVHPVLHRDALGAQLPQDELAVRVGADHAGPGDAVAQPGDADGHVRFRPGHVHAQAAAGGQRPGGPQRDHGLAKGQQVDRPGPERGSRRPSPRGSPRAGGRTRRPGPRKRGPAPASGRGRRRSRRRRTAVRRARRRWRRLPSSPRLRRARRRRRR